MKPVTDPRILNQLNEPISDPVILDQLNGKNQVDYNVIEQGFDKFAKGATFGVGPIVKSGVAAVTAKALGGEDNFGDYYKEAYDLIREEEKAFDDDNPATSTALELSGGITSGGLLGNLVIKQGGKSLARKGAELGVLGGTEGAIYGVTDSDRGLESRLDGAKKGAITGAVAAPLFGLPMAKATEMAAPQIKNLYSRLIDSPKEQAEKAVANTASKVFEPEEAAAEYIRLGDEGALVDIAPNMQQYARHIIDNAEGSAGREARVFAENRQLGNTDRMTKLIETASGKSADSYDSMLNNLKAERATKAKPYYEKAFSEAEVSEEMKSLLSSRPSLKKAYAQASRLAADHGEELVSPFHKYHYAKKALDDMIEMAKNKRTGGNEKLSALTALKKDLVGAMGKASPEYDQGRQLFAGDSELINAAELGEKFVKKTAREVQAETANLTPSEKDLYKHGAILSVVEDMEKGALPNQAGRKTLKRDMQKKLAHLFGSKEEADKIIDAALKERSFAATHNRLIGGSQTSTNQAGTTMYQDSKTLFNSALNDESKTMDEAIKILLNQNYTVDEVIELLRKKSKEIPNMSGAIGGASAAAVSGAIN